MKRTTVLGLVIVALASPYLVHGGDDKEAKHLRDARALVKKLDLKNTDYEKGQSRVTFTGDVQCVADCSGFLDALLQHSYGYDETHFKKWFGSKRPTAARYHDAIVDKNGFTQITRVKDMLPGDLLAVKYLVRKDNTGHVMLVSAPPQPMKPKEPLVEGTEQWQVKVIDCSVSGHGTTDTRHKKGIDGKDHRGLGEGVFRLYTDKQGKVVGFSWSTLAASKFMEPAQEDLVIGRLVQGFKPRGD